MRLTIIAASLLALAACQPDAPKPDAAKPEAAKTDAAAPAAKEPTPEEMGQDDPNTPFTPAPVGPPQTYASASSAAKHKSAGTLTVTQTPQVGPNHAGGAIFLFGTGNSVETTYIPGGATEGATPPDWSKIFTGVTGPIDAEKIMFYSVDKENVGKKMADEPLCPHATFLATYASPAPAGEAFTMVAFSGDEWPPKDAKAAICSNLAFTKAK